MKYNSHHTDLDALQRELGGSSGYSTDTVDDDEEADSDGYTAGDIDYADDDWADTGR